MPHIVIGDPSRRSARIVGGNVLDERYLGVWFIKAPDELVPGTSAEVTMCLMYWPGFRWPNREGRREKGLRNVRWWAWLQRVAGGGESWRG
jgi:hypothetical protein